MNGLTKDFQRLINVIPALIIIWLVPQLDIESKLNSWVGLMGYTRTDRWLLLPVYQNFLEFGSQLPLSAQIGSSPLSLLGSVMSLGDAQRLILSVATVLFGYLVKFRSSPGPEGVAGTVLLALVPVYGLGMYWVLNDWSEIYIAFLGMVLLWALFHQMHEAEFRWTPRQSLALIVGVVFLVLSHAGYLGAPLWTLLAFVVGSMTSASFRKNFLTLSTLARLISLFLISGAVWIDTILYLVGNEILDNARVEPSGRILTDFLSLGLAAAISDPLSGRGFIVIWPVALVTAIAFGRKSHKFSQVSKNALKAYFLSLSMLALIIASSVFGNLPFEPSLSFLWRDGANLLLFGLVASLLSEQPRETSVFGRSAHKVATAMLALLIFSAAASAVLGNYILEARGSDRGFSGDTIDCTDFEKGRTLWLPESVWRWGSSRTTAFSNCDLESLIQGGYNSVGAWLKMRQSFSDDDTSFELENRTTDPHRSYDSDFGEIVILCFEDADCETVTGNHAQMDGHQSLTRCTAEGCVLRLSLSDTSGAQVFRWNQSDGLHLSSSTVEIENWTQGELTLKPEAQIREVFLHYEATATQRVSVISHWLLAFAFITQLLRFVFSKNP